jgi:type IV secretory pathway TrbD component
LPLETHRVHQSLLRPPLFMGVERRLFFTIATGVAPIIGYGSLSLPTIVILAVYLTLSYAVAARLTVLDQDLVSLLLASGRYRDHYDPLPSPSLPGRRPLGRKR